MLMRNIVLNGTGIDDAVGYILIGGKGILARSTQRPIVTPMPILKLYGIDVATVSGSLGHNNQVTTLSIYSHMFQEFQAKACDAVINALNFTRKTENYNNEKPPADSSSAKQSA